MSDLKWLSNQAAYSSARHLARLLEHRLEKPVSPLGDTPLPVQEFFYSHTFEGDEDITGQMEAMASQIAAGAKAGWDGAVCCTWSPFPLTERFSEGHITKAQVRDAVTTAVVKNLNGKDRFQVTIVAYIVKCPVKSS